MRLLKKHCRSAEKRLKGWGEDLACVRYALRQVDAEGDSRCWSIRQDLRGLSRDELVKRDMKLTHKIEVAIEPVWVDVASSRFASWRSLADERPRVFRGPEAGLLPRLHRIVQDEATARIARVLIGELGPEMKRREQASYYREPVWSSVPNLSAEMFAAIARWAAVEGRNLEQHLRDSNWAAFTRMIREEELILDRLGRRALPYVGSCAGREFRFVPPACFDLLASRFNNCAGNGAYEREAQNGGGVMLASFDRAQGELPVGMYYFKPRAYCEDSIWVGSEFQGVRLVLSEHNTSKDPSPPDAARIGRWACRASTRRKMAARIPSHSRKKFLEDVEIPSDVIFQSLNAPSDNVMARLRTHSRQPISERELDELRKLRKILAAREDELTEQGAAILGHVSTVLDATSRVERAERRAQAADEVARHELSDSWSRLEEFVK